MISVTEALAKITDLVSPTETEMVPIADAANRILSEDVKAMRDQPPFAASAMDGYAVLQSDAVAGNRLLVVDEASAGSRADAKVTKGTAVRIFTGAPVPVGADKILIQEDCTREGDTICVSENVDQASYIRAKGKDFQKGSLVKAQTVLAPSALSLVAAMNIPQLPVHRKPVIALVPTGSELLYPGEEPGPDQIISSNNFGLKALIEAAGGTANLLPIARDDPESLRTVLELAAGADVIVTLGGASVGDHDLMGQMAQKGELKTSFYKVAMRPGKPILAGKYKDTPLIGLPGNPVSALVCGYVFLLPAISKMLGGKGSALKRRKAQLANAIGKNGPREHYMRATVSETENGTVIEPARKQDSSLLSVMTEANALMIRPPNQAAFEEGTLIEYLAL